MIEGRSCKLGEFRQLSLDEIERIYSPGASVTEPAPVESADVEELESDPGDNDD